MRATTTVQEKWAKLKPRFMAVCLGLIVGPFISNAIGWQVTSGTLERQLYAAVIEQQANFCLERIQATGINTNGIDFGTRRDLAEKWGVMPGQESAEYDVIRACSEKIVG
jgi:hypothetical protein